MSITDELREWWVRKFPVMDKELHKDFIAIADRIDAEHQKAMSRAGQLLADAEKDRDYNYANWQDCKQKVLQGNITFDELNAKIEHLMDELAHRIEMPKDADGEPWNLGDRDEDGNEVIALKLASDGWFVITDGEWLHRPGKHHYHAQTVEDVLTEFGIDWEHESDCEDRAALLKEYAAKLRLREDA